MLYPNYQRCVVCGKILEQGHQCSKATLAAIDRCNEDVVGRTKQSYHERLADGFNMLEGRSPGRRSVLSSREPIHHAPFFESDPPAQPPVCRTYMGPAMKPVKIGRAKKKSHSTSGQESEK